MTKMWYMAIGNGETVRCKLCDFNLVMDDSNIDLIFGHTHEGIKFDDMWDIEKGSVDI
jgi:hypothetical protein